MKSLFKMVIYVGVQQKSRDNHMKASPLYKPISLLDPLHSESLCSCLFSQIRVNFSEISILLWIVSYHSFALSWYVLV